MNRNEVLKVLSTLKAAYPSFYRGMSRRDADEAVILWCDMLAGDDAAQVESVVRDFIAGNVSGFPPNIGEIRAKLPKSRDIAPGMFTDQAGELEKHRVRKARRRAAGIPATWEEAQRAGMNSQEWGRVLNQSGQDVGAIL